MGTQERREREKQEIRARILDVARALFAREGYEAVSMRRIAQEIEYSPTAIYLHFKDKESLFGEICETDFRGLARIFLELRHVSDPLERLVRIGVAYTQFGLQYPNHYRLMFMTPHPPAPPEQVEADRGRLDTDAYAFFVATIQQCIESGRLRDEQDDPELIAQMLWASTHGVVALHIAMGHDESWIHWRPALETAATLIDIMVRGMLRDGDTARDRRAAWNAIPEIESAVARFVAPAAPGV